MPSDHDRFEKHVKRVATQGTDTPAKALCECDAISFFPGRAGRVEYYFLGDQTYARCVGNEYSAAGVATGTVWNCFEDFIPLVR